MISKQIIVIASHDKKTLKISKGHKYCFLGPHETPSSSSTHYNPPPRMVSEPPLPAKGILKKSNSNPQLTKIEQV